VTWAKEQIEAFADMFRRQVYAPDIPQQTVEECSKIIASHNRKVSLEPVCHCFDTDKTLFSYSATSVLTSLSCSPPSSLRTQKPHHPTDRCSTYPPLPQPQGIISSLHPTHRPHSSTRLCRRHRCRVQVKDVPVVSAVTRAPTADISPVTLAIPWEGTTTLNSMFPH
jgi:hypothetical protein